MADRTIKLLGKAYSTEGNVSITVNFNGTQVFSGEVSTTNGSTPVGPPGDQVFDELASWTISTDDTGSIPLSIAVSGGDILFFDLQGNYSGWECQLDENGQSVLNDSNQYVVITEPVDYFGDLNINTVESDGKTNISYSPDNGQNTTRAASAEFFGDWCYKIQEGETLSCDFYIDPDGVLINRPVNAGELAPRWFVDDDFAARHPETYGT